MVEYKDGVECIDWRSLCQLYFEVGLVAGIGKQKNEKKIKQSFESSKIVVTAWDNEKLIGAGRIITDGVCYGCIYDVGVLPLLQGRGIGKGIMKHLLNKSKHLKMVHLWPTKGSTKFYENLGFRAIEADQPIMIRKNVQQTNAPDV
jgi:N-acetylglutamate synthase-like GNAT family acetyltransferase